MRIHNIVREKSEAGFEVIIVRKREHPEVLGIAGQCKSAEIVGSEEEIISLLENRKDLEIKPICVVAQTTVGIGNTLSAKLKGVEFKKNHSVKYEDFQWPAK
jgi:4-hydroxy-3-methylbut-2-enyl diphosphate reductase